MAEAEYYFIGVDVGTGSVRAALVNINGKILAVKVKPIKTWNPKPDFYQQSSEDIWQSCCEVIKEVKKSVPKDKIKGIGFDATCSLVAVDGAGSSVSVSPDGNAEQNIILWMDHRAEKQANFINSLGHNILRNVGGKISLEMELPKLMWLKENLNSQCWKKTEKFFDLPDFLTWKATGCDTRSLCSVTCKWLYEVNSDGQGGWNKNFLERIDLAELADNNFIKIGSVIKQPGEPCGTGLKADIARVLDLLEGTAVATSIIDAHAGGLGLIGCHAASISQSITSRLPLVCGTSTCHMAVSKEAVFVNGVWGPYWSAMVPGLWLNEAGQSASGCLLDHIISTHPASSKIKLEEGQHIVGYLNTLLKKIASRNGKLVDVLTKDIHVLPDFHGNRSPLADPTMKGMICGLSLSTDEEQLAILYLATVQALAYGTKHIMEKMVEEGHETFSSVLVCGGLSKNPLFVKTQANVSLMPVLVPHEAESVLLGAAILGATASGIYDSVLSAISSMAGKAEVISPEDTLQR
ncbi:FGGY carbohydrate kinase domain-containing protein [Halyomorpha halys]|uniref:FGGY carbohydrate kinase domain-containing protein n=1 Tax=Halyomorpha halys TaxID=286706 RepID=UPI0034D2B4C2